MPRTQSSGQGWRSPWIMVAIVLAFSFGAIFATRCAGDEAGVGRPDPLTTTAADSVGNLWRTVAGAGGSVLVVALLLLWRAWRTAIKAVDRLVGTIEAADASNIKDVVHSLGARGESDWCQDAAGRLIHKRVRRNE